MATPLLPPNSLDSALLRDFLHLGWLYPTAPAAKVICADLVAQAAADDWDVEPFIDLAIKRVPAWIRSKLAVRQDVLDIVTQNFVLRMMERRPDLFHDPQKNTLEAYLVGLLRVIERESWRQEWPARIPEDVSDGDRRQESPAEQLEHAEDVEIVAALLDQLPAEQRDAVKEKYFGTDAVPPRPPIPSRVIHVRRSRGLSAMRNAASQLGIGSCRMTGRRRMPRAHRRPRGRAALRGNRITATHRGNCETVAPPATVSEREREVRASNARALQRLLSSLPSPLSESGEALARVMEIFDQRFARRLTRSRRSD